VRNVVLAIDDCPERYVRMERRNDVVVLVTHHPRTLATLLDVFKDGILGVCLDCDLGSAPWDGLELAQGHLVGMKFPVAIVSCNLPKANAVADLLGREQVHFAKIPAMTPTWDRDVLTLFTLFWGTP
jgi:hypothetical protein